MQNGRLITPSGGSARDALVEARRLDPTDTTLAQAVRDLGAQLAEEARKAIAAGKNDEAQTFVNSARQLGFAGAALASVERSLNEANRAATAASAAKRPVTSGNPVVDGLAASVRQRISEGKLIDPRGESARDALNKLRAEAPTRPEVEELSRALSTRLLEVSKQAMAAKAYDRAGQLIAGARDVGLRYNEAAIVQAEADLSAAREASAAQNIVSAASLKRTRTVNPVYPDAARKRGIEGWVELSFTVMPNGAVDDIQVRNASPAEVFDEAAIKAVRQWRFEPIERNGEKVAQRAMVRLKFSQSQ
jgi:TonB family protein